MDVSLFPTLPLFFSLSNQVTCPPVRIFKKPLKGPGLQLLFCCSERQREEEVRLVAVASYGSKESGRREAEVRHRGGLASLWQRSPENRRRVVVVTDGPSTLRPLASWRERWPLTTAVSDDLKESGFQRGERHVRTRCSILMNLTGHRATGRPRRNTRGVCQQKELGPVTAAGCSRRPFHGFTGVQPTPAAAAASQPCNASGKLAELGRHCHSSVGERVRHPLQRSPEADNHPLVRGLSKSACNKELWGK